MDLLIEQDVLILQELDLREEFIHLHCVLLSGVFYSSDGDVLASDEILHVLRRIGLLLRREVMIEVHLLYLRLFLLGPLPFFELLIRRQSPHRLPPRVLLLNLINQLLQLEVPTQSLSMLSSTTCQFLSLAPHLLCQFEHALLIAGVSVAMSGGLTVFLRDILITLLKLVNLSGQSSDVLVLLPDQFFQSHQLLLL